MQARCCASLDKLFGGSLGTACTTRPCADTSSHLQAGINQDADILISFQLLFSFRIAVSSRIPQVRAKVRNVRLNRLMPSHFSPLACFDHA